MSSKNIRDVAPIFQRIRDFLLGRSHTQALRFKFALASRSPPPPDLPDGPSHLLSKNYYYTRDARREVEPPEIITAGAKRIGAGGSEECKDVLERRPGKLWKWD